MGPGSALLAAALLVGVTDGSAASEGADAILRGQPRAVIERLMQDEMIVLQEVRESGALSGSIITALVIFNRPVDDVYRLLARTDRQGEFRPGVQIVTVERRPEGPVDEHHLKILFRRYVYRLAYRLEPATHRIGWTLDRRFSNDLKRVDGSWELFAMSQDRTLGRSGTIVDVGAAVPAFLQDWITRSNLPDTMRRVRRWVDSDGRYRP